MTSLCGCGDVHVTLGGKMHGTAEVRSPNSRIFGLFFGGFHVKSFEQLMVVNWNPTRFLSERVMKKR